MPQGFTLSVKSDIKEVARYLSRVQKKQVPFATALALTRTAQSVQRSEKEQIPRKLDRPVPFTERNAIGLTAAKKTNLTATVFVKDIQEKYLQWSIFGGTARAQGKGFGVPTRNKKLNRYGNIAGRRQGLVKGQKQFIGTIRGISGVWERTGGKRKKGVKLVVAFEKTTRYQTRFPFFQIAEHTAKATFVGNFNRALSQALATAR